MNKQSKKILIRGVNWIGDAVLTIPAIKSIRKAFPDAHISLLVKPWVSDIFKESKDVDEVILYGNEFKGLKGKLRLAKKLRLKKFDSSILLQNAFDAALITWLARIPERIGYITDFRSLLLTKALPVEDDILSQHQVYYYLNIVNSAGIKTAGIQPYLHLTNDERLRAREHLLALKDRHQPLIGINPGATFGSSKRWPPERYADVILKIIHELNGRVVIFGSPSETEIAYSIMSLIKAKHQEKGLQTFNSESFILNMSGKTSLRELAALISQCNALITNDSGPMHMASALLVPIVAIFGSTNKATTGPFGQGHKIISKNVRCAPCMKRECPDLHLKCMTDITSDDVFTGLKEVLPRERAIFLDKDGTLIEDKNYLNSFKDMIIFPEVKESLAKLTKQGFKLIGITNQSGIARKIVDEDFVIKSNTYLKDKLGIDDFYYCPHHPDERCPCRKPGLMFALMARIKHSVNLETSYVIGDKESDILLAHNINATGILLAAHPPENTLASYIAKDLRDATDWILERESKSSRT